MQEISTEKESFTPLDYQAEDIQFLLDTPCAALLYWMGLGKTATLLSALDDLMFNQFTVKKTLVLGPKNVIRATWPDEVDKWAEFRAMTYAVLHGKDKDQLLMRDTDLYFINYEGLKWLYNKYQDKTLRGRLPYFDMVVADESTRIKNATSKTSKYCKALFGNVPRKVDLTGTIAPNGYIDLFGQMDFLQPGLLAKNITGYRNAYFLPPAEGNPSKKYVLRSGVKDIIANKIAPYVRVRGKDCIKQKDPVLNTIYCDLPEKEMKQYEKMEKDFYLELEDGGSLDIFSAGTLSMKLRQFIQGFVYDTENGTVHDVNRIKALALKELVESLNGQPLLCGIQFQYEVDMLRKVFGYRVPAMYSPTSDKEEMENIRMWNRGEIKLLLMHPQSGGIGLNLQAGGSDVLWFSQTWNLEHYQQMNARIDRLGQKDGVIIHHLVMRDTVDEVIVDVLKHKAKEQSELLTAIELYGRSHGKKITGE